MLKQVFLSLFFLNFGVEVIRADSPDIKPKILLEAGGSLIDLGSDTIPVCMDWNNDGAKDLLVGGYFTDGHINLYLNSGTDLNPVYAAGVKVKSGGKPIMVSTT